MTVTGQTVLEHAVQHRLSQRLEHGAPPPEPYVVSIRPVHALRPSECVDQAKVIELADTVRCKGHWTQPVPIEASTGLVMDGNHRLQVAQLLGLRYLPCVPLRYDDPRVSVACWRTGQPFELRQIFQVVEQQVLLPFKTTRHHFAPGLPRTEIPLDLLMAWQPGRNDVFQAFPTTPNLAQQQQP
ncbi:transcriptional regulator [Roseateles sp. BYS96W]|uniref:Transcriptional regulator n=1 Tax=Pelomonas nitida TaxID=3299027 RepID=A0ABW7G1H9_9BURK